MPWFKRKQPAPQYRPLTQTIGRTIEAGEWEPKTRFWLVHKCGVALWIANDDYGLKVYESDDVNAVACCNLPDEDRRALWGTIQAWMQRRLEGRILGRGAGSA